MPTDFKTYLDDLNKNASRKYSAKEILSIMPRSEFTNIPDIEEEEAVQQDYVTPKSTNSQIDRFLSKHSDRDPEILREGFNAIQERVKNRDGIRYGEPITADHLEELGRKRIEAQAPSLFKEGMKSFARGVVQLPAMAGKGLQWLDPDGGSNVVENAGQAMENFSNKYQEKFRDDIAPSKQAEISEWYSPRRMVAYGPENLVASAVPMAVGLGATALTGGNVVAGYAAGTATLGALFYGGSAEEKYRQAKEHGLDDDAAFTLANLEGGIEAGGEIIADLIPIGLIGKATARVQKGVIKSIAQGEGLKGVLKTIGTTMIGETATEVAQAAAQTAISNKMGVDVGGVGKNVADVIAPTIFMSLVFGGVAGVARHQNLQQNKKAITETLSNPDATQEDFDTALKMVVTAASDIDKTAAKNFEQYAIKQRQAGQPIVVQDDDAYIPHKQALAQWATTGQRNGEEFTPDHAYSFLREKLQTGDFTDDDLQDIKNNTPVLADVVNRIDAERVVESANQMANIWTDIENRVEQEEINQFDEEWNSRANPNKKQEIDYTDQVKQTIDYKFRDANQQKINQEEQNSLTPPTETKDDWKKQQENIDAGIQSVRGSKQEQRLAQIQEEQKRLGEQFQKDHKDKIRQAEIELTTLQDKLDSGIEDEAEAVKTQKKVDRLQRFITKAQSEVEPETTEELPTIEGMRQKLQGYREREQAIQGKIDNAKDDATKEHLNKNLERVQNKIEAIERGTPTTPDVADATLTESAVRLKFKTLDDARKDFIDKKIQEIGSIEAVQAKYKDDAVVDNYARERAREIFGETTPAVSENLTNQAGIVEDSKVKPDFTTMIQDAAKWKGAAEKADALYGDDKKTRLKHSKMTTKGDLDAYLMKRYGIDESTARDVSNTLTRDNIKSDNTSNIEDYAGYEWADTALNYQKTKADPTPAQPQGTEKGETETVNGLLEPLPEGYSKQFFDGWDKAEGKTAPHKSFAAVERLFGDGYITKEQRDSVSPEQGRFTPEAHKKRVDAIKSWLNAGKAEAAKETPKADTQDKLLGNNPDGNPVYESAANGNRYYIEKGRRFNAPMVVGMNRETGVSGQPYSAQELYRDGRAGHLTDKEYNEFESAKTKADTKSSEPFDKEPHINSPVSWKDKNGVVKYGKLLLVQDGIATVEPEQRTKELPETYSIPVSELDIKKYTKVPKADTKPKSNKEEFSPENLLAEWDRQVAEREAESKTKQTPTENLKQQIKDKYGDNPNIIVGSVPKVEQPKKPSRAKSNDGIDVAKIKASLEESGWTPNSEDRTPEQQAKLNQTIESKFGSHPVFQELAAAKKAETKQHISNALEKFKQINNLLGERGSFSTEKADENIYAQMKVLLQEALDEIILAGQSAKEYVKLALDNLTPKGRPYLEKFVNEDMVVKSIDQIEKEKQDGSINNDDGKNRSSQENDKGSIEGKSPEDVSTTDAAGTTPNISEPEGKGNDGGLRTGERSSSVGVEQHKKRQVSNRGRSRVGNDGSSSVGRDDVESSGVPRRNRGNDHRIEQGDLERTGSWLSTAKSNLDAIELYKKITEENRQATPEEQKILAKYVGWGSSELANNMFPAYSQLKKVNPEWAKTTEWKAQVERLVEVLTSEEIQTAVRSTQYAHYTSEKVVRSIYKALDGMGFKGGKILEPGMGVGNFVGLLPDNMLKNTVYTGIEMDHITAGIAKLLYPNQNILQADFTKQTLPKNFFDAAIGNPPFGNIKILSDPEYSKQSFTLHNYFFVKSIDRVRPGGLLVFVTSRYTMDSQKDIARKYLADRADLLGAIRLPQTAFKQNAGTDVVTDVLFLRKREDGAKPSGQAWTSTSPISLKENDSENNKEVQINEYFASHPEMVLGEHSLAGKMYSKNEYTVTPIEGEIEELFAKAVEKLPKNVYSKTTAKTKAVHNVQTVIERDFNPKNKKEGGLYLADDGNLMKVDFGSGVPLDSIKKVTEKQQAMLKDYIKLRDKLKLSNLAQLNEGDWQTALKDLNKEYDKFVKRHGNIQEYTTVVKTQTNEDGIEEKIELRKYKHYSILKIADVESPIVWALEKINDEGQIVKGAGLTDRVINRPSIPEIKSIPDALAVSLDNLGVLDLDHVAKLINRPVQEVIDTLGDLLYISPSNSQYVLADEYLSGDVVAKLEEAEVAAESDPKYKRNVEALKAVQPEPLTTADITVLAGSTWIPEPYYNEFAAEVLEMNTPRISYDNRIGSWTITGSFSEQQYRGSSEEWSHETRGKNEILDAIMNNRGLRITYTVEENGVKKTVLDQEATAAVNEIAKKMRSNFSSWVWQDVKRANTLLDIYNRQFNNLAPRKIDGSHLTLPGISSRFKLYSHQKDAIWRILQTGNTYLNHAVGAGKTYTMIAAGMEMKRLGMVKKPMYVVPKHMLEQFSQEFQELYPMATIMVADEDNFHTHNRKRFVAQATMNNPDAIIITHSSFGLIKSQEENIAPVRDEFIGNMQLALEDMRDEDAPRMKIKKMEKMIEQAEQRFDSLIGTGDNVVSFEEMGVDFLFIDEAHEFRKLDFSTTRQVKGIDTKGSKKAIDLYIKTLFLNGMNKGRSHVFASGTPIVNTIGEMYSILRFFDNEGLRRDNIQHFDAWANMFGEVNSDYEMNSAGRFEIVERFSKFVNIPEMMSRVRQFTDVLTNKQLGDRVDRPTIKGGSPEIVLAPKSADLKNFQDTVLQPRIENSKAWKPSKEQPGNPDPLINIITDGRLASIDLRFVDTNAKNNPNSKLNKYIDGIIDSYKETKNNEYFIRGTDKKSPVKGGSIICFYNVGFGKSVALTRGFDARKWAMKRFKEAGIPENHIAWIDDYDTAAKKQALFKQVREGQKRIMLGSAKKMGTGVNAQTRLTHLHYLDAPWFPADVEQPDGRIVRQGNQNKEVTIKRYATEGSYDSTMWQMVARKSQFIEQAWTGEKGVRTLEDVSEASQYAMASALASGDQRMIQLVGLQADVDRLQKLRGAHGETQQRLAFDKRQIEQDLREGKKKLQRYKEAQKKYPVYIGSNNFVGTVNGKSFDKRNEFNEALKEAFKKEFLQKGKNKYQDKYRNTQEQWTEYPFNADINGAKVGVKIYAPNPDALQGILFIKFTDDLGSNHLEAFPERQNVINPLSIDEIFDSVNVGTRVVNAINSISSEVSTKEKEINDKTAELGRITKRLGSPFEYERDYTEKYKELRDLEAELAAEGQETPATAPENPNTTTLDVSQVSDTEETGGEAQYSKAQPVKPATPASLDELPRKERKIAENLIKQGTLNPLTNAQALNLLQQSGEALYSTAWHGSPHFVDAFSSDKIGIGEGQQVYGYGLYFAGSKKVAEWYQKEVKSSMANSRRTFKGQELVIGSAGYQAASLLDNKSLASVKKEVKGWIDNAKEGEDVKRYKDILSFLQWAESKSDFKKLNKGYLYQVDLKPNEDEYLLWDKPFNELSEKIKKALSGLGLKEVTPPQGGKAYLITQGKFKDKIRIWNGEDLYKRLSDKLGSDKAASEYLLSLGIRGIKYLDGTSRGKGKGNYNYVIFNDKDVTIEAKYSKDGLIQGFVLNGKAYIVPENIESGKMWNVIRHEVGTHIGQMLQNDPEFNRLKNRVKLRRDEQSPTGEAIRKAYARAESADTKPEFMEEEVLGYLVEDSPDVSIARKFIALIKKYLAKIGINYDLTQADMVALADIAVRREANRRDKNRQQGEAKFAKAEGKPLNTDTPDGGNKTMKIDKETKSLIQQLSKLPKSSSYLDRHNINGKVVQRFHGDWIVFEKQFGREKKHIFPTKEILAAYINKDFKGIEFLDPKTTGVEIPIIDLEKTSYRGQDMKWTEIKTGEFTTKKEIFGYHYSDNKIKNFGEKQTAFFTEPYNKNENYGYRLTIPKGTYVEEYGNNEIRINLTKNMKIEELSKGWSNFKLIDDNNNDVTKNVFRKYGIKGTFDPQNPDIRFSIAPAAAQSTPTRLEDRFQQDTKLSDVMQDLFTRAKSKEERTLAKDKVIANTLDHLHFIKQRLGEKTYQLHRVLTGINTSQIAMFLEHGKFNLAANAANNNDVLVVTDKKKGFIPFLESIGDDFANLFYYTAAKRSLELRGQDRENWIPESEAKDFLKRVGTKAKNGKTWEELNREFQGFNKNVLDVAEHAGLIRADQRAEWESDYYLPFYRVLEDEQSKLEYLSKPHSNHQHLSAQIRRLKGGVAEIGNPLENILTNWMHLLNTAAENKARKEAFNVGSRLGIIAEVPKAELINVIGSQTVEKYAVKKIGNTKASALFDTKDEALQYVDDRTTPKNQYSIEKRKETIVRFGNMKDKGILSFQREGQPVYFKSSDADLFEALSGIDIKKFDNTIMKVMGASKRLLSYAATFGAGFKIRNMIRDTVHVAVTSKSFMPVVDSAKGFLKAIREDADYIEFMSTGFGFGSSYVDSDTPEIGSKYIKKILKKEGEGALDRIIRTPAKMLKLWEKIGAAGENAARVALYSNLKAKGMTPLEAGFQARDLMDFSMRGGSTSVQMLTRTIPFLNARVQAFYKLGRSANADPKAFAAKAAMLTFAGLALWAVFKDDDRYKELEDWDKWTYYHLWLGDEHYRIPKPFEIGALFNSLPETIANVQNGNDEGKMVWDWFKFTAHDILRVDLPQLVKPILEDKFNKSTFTKREIIPDYMARLPPEEQYNAWTPALARAMGDVLGVSPLKVQHYIRGYFASIGMGTMIATDAFIRNMMDYPVSPSSTITDYIPLVGDNELSQNTKYLTRFYEMWNEMDAATRTFNHYKKTGRMDEAIKFGQENKGLISAKKSTNKMKSRISEINQQMQMIYRNETLSAEEKRERITILTKKKNRLARKGYETLTS